MIKINRRNDLLVAVSLLLAFLLWFVTFVVKPMNFWLMMSFNTLLLAAISLYCCKPLFYRPSIKDLIGGIFSGLLLYAVFWAGNELLIFLSGYMQLFENRAENISVIYANRRSLPSVLVALLLFFPIGFGEELYWRGCVQLYAAKKYNAGFAWAGTIVLYTSVHLCTGNLVLILAALTCGFYWGTLYRLTGRLWLVLFSHMIWDPLIFVIKPIV
jgi:hypothetical protein